jgi:predicted phosphodiesterase
VLFVGDVHGCADELRELLEQADAERVVLVGDLFTKGPDPVGVWELVRQHRCEAVLGNHDDWLLREPGRVELPQAARRWLAALPLFILEAGLTVVHGGVHPKRGVSGTTRDMALNLRFWRPDRLWFQDYDRKPFVVYGHDAKRGLQRHERTLGLDTGCVYGGSLSGWLRAEDRLLQVPARRTYRAIKDKAVIS